MAEYVTCPTCGTKLLAADTVLGRYIRCFGCETRFLAAADPPKPVSSDDTRPPKPSALPGWRDKPLAPPQYAGDDDEDEDRPFCPGCGRQVSWHDSACPYCREEFEEEAPPARSVLVDVALPVRRDGEPHRGRVLYTLGALSAITGGLSACSFGYLAVISVPLGVTVWILAARDLRAMQDGSIDPRGRDLTRAGRSSALAGVVFGIVFAAVFLLYWLGQ
jgi:endogenous inhibitor of DNA gyrase (YacG/DUF329 family)